MKSNTLERHSPKNKEGETESLDYENWDIVQLNDKNLIFMAGGDRQMPSYVKLGVTKRRIPQSY